MPAMIATNCVITPMSTSIGIRSRRLILSPAAISDRSGTSRDGGSFGREAFLEKNMTELTKPDIATRLKKIDFCMMSTKGAADEISNRPMSNNGDVEYDGDSWFFSYGDTRKVADIERDATVTLSFTEAPSLLGKPGIFISIEGEALLIRERSVFERHWTKSLDRWFPDGIDTTGLVLLKVHADRIHYWDGEENGTIET